MAHQDDFSWTEYCCHPASNSKQFAIESFESAKVTKNDRYFVYMGTFAAPASPLGHSDDATLYLQQTPIFLRRFSKKI